jgi:hypothetical protein
MVLTVWASQKDKAERTGGRDCRKVTFMRWTSASRQNNTQTTHNERQHRKDIVDNIIITTRTSLDIYPSPGGHNRTTTFTEGCGLISGRTVSWKLRVEGKKTNSFLSTPPSTCLNDLYPLPQSVHLLREYSLLHPESVLHPP